MEIIRVNLKKAIDESYGIHIEAGLLKSIPSILKRKEWGSRYAIITDSNVAKLYGYPLLQSFKNAGIPVEMFIFPAGEKNKSRGTKAMLEDALVSSGFGRDTLILALGGGVVGDVAGFVAATFMRGVHYVHLPTTLIASDSAVGGKCGIDIPSGKNLIGAFHQPKAVYFDVDTLRTLPFDELKNGLAETIKHAMIADAVFFTYLEKHLEEILRGSLAHLSYCIKKNCEIKAQIVEQDENEHGKRKILNYGHTFGHAVEQVSEYSVPHGHAIAMGMSCAARLANKLGFLPSADLDRQQELLSYAGLPTAIPPSYDRVRLMEAMQSDKKVRGGAIHVVLVKAVGNALVTKDVTREQLMGVL